MLETSSSSIGIAIAWSFVLRAELNVQFAAENHEGVLRIGSPMKTNMSAKGIVNPKGMI
jgi:hypothetical protein